MSRKLRLDNDFIRCTKGCKKEYDIAELSLKARRENKRNLYCPNCGQRVGTLN